MLRLPDAARLPAYALHDPALAQASAPAPSGQAGAHRDLLLPSPAAVRLYRHDLRLWSSPSAPWCCWCRPRWPAVWPGCGNPGKQLPAAARMGHALPGAAPQPGGLSQSGQDDLGVPQQPRCHAGRYHGPAHQPQRGRAGRHHDRPLDPVPLRDAHGHLCRLRKPHQPDHGPHLPHTGHHAAPFRPVHPPGPAGRHAGHRPGGHRPGGPVRYRLCRGGHQAACLLGLLDRSWRPSPLWARRSSGARSVFPSGSPAPPCPPWAWPSGARWP